MSRKITELIPNGLILLFASFMLFSCSKTETPWPGDPLIKKRFGFKPGSYWIFRDSISGRVDSCYLYSLEYKQTKGPATNPYISELLYIQLKQQPLDSTISSTRYWTYSFFDSNSLSCSFLAEDRGYDDLRWNMLLAEYPLPGGL